MTKPLYDAIGQEYDSTRRPDPYLADRIHELLEIEVGKHYLDLACGTGNYTNALRNMNASFVGLDNSQEMLTSAHQKATKAAWILGTGEALPFVKNGFPGAICSLAIHHFKSLLPVFSEVYRVLEAGRFVIFTSTPEQMAGYWLNKYFPDTMRKSQLQMPSLESVAQYLGKAGFQNIETEQYSVREDLVDLFLYSGKHRPSLYLNPQFRSGISSFAALANQEEVAIGCDLLAADIASRRIWNVIKDFENDKGDYLFIVAEKTG